ncbi:MAG: hypothetical protein EOP60_11155 [Sphingomonadales bacterium]|nr:MAG: hypothetical protein EOP60_11155 [Sphingomonadales bacterium]
MATPQCARQVNLPAGLAAWSRSREGLGTRHATVLKPRDGRIETRVTIRKAGIFGIAIGREGWIDVAPAGGKALRMVSENRGPRCSGIRKIVRYRLRPGEYRVTVTRMKGEPVRVMLVHGSAR